jgi:hypothetical protein
VLTRICNLSNICVTHIVSRHSRRCGRGVQAAVPFVAEFPESYSYCLALGDNIFGDNILGITLVAANAASNREPRCRPDLMTGFQLVITSYSLP